MESHSMTVRYAPLNGWLMLLAAGWRLPFVVEPMWKHHGAHAVLMLS